MDKQIIVYEPNEQCLEPPLDLSESLVKRPATTFFAKFEGAQNITFRVEKDGSEIEVVGGEIAPDDNGVYTTEKGVFKFFGDELVGYAFDAETRAAMREFFDTAYWC